MQVDFALTSFQNSTRKAVYSSVDRKIYFPISLQTSSVMACTTVASYALAFVKTSSASRPIEFTNQVRSELIEDTQHDAIEVKVTARDNRTE